MKKIILSLIIMACPLMMLAQNTRLDKLFDEYADKEGYTTVIITKSMFDLFASVANDKDDKDLKDITGKLDKIRILSCDCKSGTKATIDFYNRVIENLPKQDYEDLMVINDGHERVKFAIRKRGDKITELIMVVGGSDACVISLQGDIDLKQVAKLSKTMNIKGLEHLNNVSTKKK